MLSKHPEFQKLLLLHSRDRRFQKLKSELLENPKEQSRLKVLIDKETESIELALNDWKALEAQNNSLENEILTLSENVNRLKGKQLEVKKNEEYAALENEIGSTLEKQSLLEDQQIEVLLKIDDARKTADLAETKIREKIEVYKEQLSKTRSRAVEVEVDLSNLDEEIKQARSEVEIELLSNYDRTKTVITKPPYIAPVADQRCSGCNLRVSNDVVSSILVEQKITHCDQCGRIVYMER